MLEGESKLQHHSLGMNPFCDDSVCTSDPVAYWQAWAFAMGSAEAYSQQAQCCSRVGRVRNFFVHSSCERGLC